jgi:hypothetical protein
MSSIVPKGDPALYPELEENIVRLMSAKGVAG